MEEWIPIPEHDTPDDDGKYICTIYDGTQRYVDSCEYSRGYDEWYGSDGTIVNVIAWQPLPKPYY